MIGLLVWLHLLAQMTLYAAEINVVVIRRLWPRSLLGPPDVPADQETLAALAKVEQRHDYERVDVHFTDELVPARVPARRRARTAHRPQNSRSAASRRVISSGHEHSPPSAGQPSHTPR